MTTLHVQVVIPCKSGLKRDECINTFTFTAGVTPADFVAAIEGPLDNFYNAVNTSRALSQYLSGSRDRTAGTSLRKYYDVTAHLNGSPSGPPIAEMPFTIEASVDATHPLPEECAVALSFHGDDLTIPEFAPGARPRARHRGRIYLGPLTTDGSTLDHDSRDLSRVNNALAADMVIAGGKLRDAAVGWSVWSRRNAATYLVVGGWCDDAFDTIRGRGTDPTSRLDMLPPV